MKIKITVEAFDDEGNKLSGDAGIIEDVNNVTTGLSQWIMETVIKVKMQALNQKE